MNITDTIALLAFLISLYGAVLSTLTAINDFFRLRLSYLGHSYITLSKGKEYVDVNRFVFQTFNPNSYCLAIHVRLENKSKNPTTINEFVLNNKYVINSYSQEHDFHLPTQFCKRDNQLICYSTLAIEEGTIKPLITINPLSTIEGYLFFDNLDCVPKQFNIKVVTVQKAKTFHMKFALTSDYRNEIKSE